ncbi:MAG: hypothetical protein ACQESJ_03180 [Bacteroidota bacterium]
MQNTEGRIQNAVANYQRNTTALSGVVANSYKEYRGNFRSTG